MEFLLRLLFSFAFITAIVCSGTISTFAQVESVVGQFTSTSAQVVVRDISGDGRFVVFESNGDLATQGRQDQFDGLGQVTQAGRNNADGNFEIFLFDYAQRRTFQITNTRRALKNVTGSSTTNNNIQVDIVNLNPVISNNGRYIAFASNAYSTIPNSPSTSPAFFDGNECSVAPANCNVDANGNNSNRPLLTSLRADGNLEIFLYEIPSVTAGVDLSTGANLPLTDLATGIFTQATRSPRTFPPRPGTDTQAPIVVPDNELPAINDDGSVVAFVSTRDLVPANTTPQQDNGNADDNREIFVYLRNAAADCTLAAARCTRQITRTTSDDPIDQIYNTYPAISGNGQRVAFTSTAVNPVRGGTNGANPDVNLHVFYANLDAAGEPEALSATEGAQVQITRTLRNAPENTVNIFSPGKRISRDGRFIAFESLSSSPGEASAAVQTGYAVFVYDTASNGTTTPRYRQYGARSFDDTGVVGNSGGCNPNPPAGTNGGDSCRYPSFTQSDNSLTAVPTLIFVSRINYRADGTIPATASDGLNPDASRPPQIYSTRLDGSAGASPTATVGFSRLTRIPTTTASDIQPFASNSQERLTFNLANDLGGENNDFNYEGFYLISPNNALVTDSSTIIRRFTSGASARPVGSPTVTTPTPTPSPSPSPSGSPTPTPTPVTPDAVPALSRGAIAVATYNYPRLGGSVVAAGASTTSRSFELPIELAGVTVNVNGAAAGIYSINNVRRQITFVLPKALGAGTFTVTINDNGRVSRGTLNIVAFQPDVFNKDPSPSAGGRARIVNPINAPLLRQEPFLIQTIRRRPYNVVQTRLRLFLTGVRGALATDISIRILDQTISGAQILTGAVETEQPGIFSVDFLLPATLNGVGDVPIVVTTNGGANSRLDDTAPRLQIL